MLPMAGRLTDGRWSGVQRGSAGLDWHGPRWPRWKTEETMMSDPLVDYNCIMLDGACSCKSLGDCKYLSKTKEIPMSKANPAFKFELGASVFRKDLKPFFVGFVLASYVDPDLNDIFCVIKARSGNLYIARQEDLDETKVPPKLVYSHS